MSFSWAEIKKSLQKFWSKLSRPQKIITVAAPLLVASTLIILMVWASRPQYVSIFNKLSDTDAGAITTKLKELKLDYRLADNGASIQVPQQQAAAVRLQLANAGLPGTSKFSFDYLDQMHLGETDADKKLRYVLGLQNELETTLKSLSSVADARVHIVMPEPSLFAEKEKSTTAGVTLKLIPGTKIAEDQVRAIAKLMASSIEGLTMENVTIVDTSGNTLSDILSQSQSQERLSGTQIQLKQTVEENIQRSVQSMLDKVLGPGRAVVRANVVLDFDQIKITDQRIGPGAVLSKQNTSENTTNGTSPGTVPGTTNNVPSYPTPTSSGTTSSSNKATNTENYQVDTRQEERVVSPGAIKRLSVSVMADVSQAQVDQIQSIVSSAAGIDQARGDQIQVAAIPFDKTGLQEEKNAFAQAELRRQVVLYAEYGAVVLLGLIFLLIYWRSRVRRRRAELAFENELRAVPLAEAEEMLLAQEEANLKLDKPMKSADEIERQKIRAAVEEYARKSPDEVARLLKAWLTEER